ncbi:MAG: PfkB family carbohydrate kinase [Gemmatimonadetes bacterium]|nr:PfkB family carbohydrate kinase [Gemmatimonadota bacterium]
MRERGKKYDVVTWGEGFLCLTPRGRERFEQSGGFDAAVSGGALEAAVGLARLGLRTAWLSAVGDTPLGMKLVNKVREHGVDTRHVVRVPGGRTGLCYAETGSAPRPARYWYDMEGTAFRAAPPGTVDWAAARDTAVLHLDLTAPMLVDANAGRLQSALEYSRAADHPVSILLDVTEGARLDAAVGASVLGLVESAGVVMTTRRALETIWDFEGPLAAAADLARSRFDSKHVAVVEHRLTAEGAAVWASVAVSPSGETFEERSGEIRVVDTDGALGAFAAGFLLGCLEGCNRSAVQFGNAAAALSCSIPGPLNWFTRDDLEAQIEGTGSGLRR